MTDSIKMTIEINGYEFSTELGGFTDGGEKAISELPRVCGMMAATIAGIFKSSGVLEEIYPKN